ncbi:presequence protease 2, chloroplastic/mitochondrial-like [Papaver somniferum]|uniref:presequence protease 2, chloroplastic/mitochondrial-like n=1 Tax=Papaver somniferum TaxID=3469 RepID=UPI000E705F61|nr:presequence protease 2, chloroplastic/mitochondrial-like [Papaver somniferum]XP_026401643.1 presequence protease 2, chloroplastic/mitochondrial-like [Papaver somniferum]XP_026401649.1 presequence protease 2, chloroplastic/mitochondrial-like [Papaver somniferum]
MERAILLRTLSCSSSISGSRLFFFRSFQNLTRRRNPSSTIFSHKQQQNGFFSKTRNSSSSSSSSNRWISTASSPSLISPLQRRKFSSFSPLAAVPQNVSSSGLVQNDVAEKLGFEVVSEQEIDECKSKAVLYKHKKTGAEIMSVANDDENKVFGIVFRTPPKDSTGIPHILEHSVLCGSRKYPLKEPFVELLKGSLHTFLNAFTYPDRTCYPVASTNSKDFYNLVDVYLDAVFFPKCVEDFQTFQQEGWHYELNDPSEDISFKGVVFNEMKGVYSQPDNIMGRASQQAMFPDTTYGVDSGGDPQVIPKLTYEEFKDFHRKFYHPSNARIWFYGDDDPTERLRILSEYLDLFESNSASNESKVQLQSLFSKPVRIVEKYPASEGSDLKKKHMVCLNWLLSEKPLDLETELTLGFLDHLLLGTPGAPLRRILLESGLGEAIVGGGIEDELLQPQFSIGLKGVSDDDIQKVEELVMSTLKKLAEEGFDAEAVEASMNTIEFSMRENNTGSFPRGLSLMLRSIGKWIYDMDPFEPLKYEKPLTALKARIAEEGPKAVFCPLIEKFIINNPHLVTVEMQPDAKKASLDEAAEKEILEKVKAGMTEEDLAELARATQELRLKQETPDPPEALKSVPSLSLKDIPRQPMHIPIEIGEIDGVKVLKHDLFTNDVLYTEIVFDMSSLKQEQLQLVPLFCQSLLEMGTKDLDFVQLNQLIGRKTGGISVYPSTSSVRGKVDPCSHIIVRGKAMAGRTEDLFNLVNCILQDVQFTDQQRFKQFVSQSKARMENRLRGSGHGIAAARMDAKLNVAGWISEQMGGLSYLEFLKSLEQRVDEDWAGISSSLEEIRRSLLSKKGCLVNMTADGKNLANSEKFVSKFLNLLPSTPPTGNTWSARLSPGNEAIVIPTQVNYVGKAANIYETGYQLNGSAYVISKHISNTWLWDRVRVSGGAYGGFCNFDTHSGVFSYLSYRDPNLLKTLDVYDGTANFLRELEMDDDTLTKAIIGTIGDVDSYQLPDAKGYTSLQRYLLGITEEERQQRREQILSTSVSDFKEFSNALEAVKDKGVVVAVASAADVSAANEERPNFFEVNNAL